jgi:predicted transcriptional regulator
MLSVSEGVLVVAGEQWFLREIRDELGIPQKQLARAAKVSQVRISNLETGKELPTRSEIDAIVKCIAARAAGRAFEKAILSVWS